MNKFILFFIFFYPLHLVGQISIEPNVTLSYVWLQVEENNNSESEFAIENNRGYQYGVGIELGAILFDKTTINLRSQLNQLVNNGRLSCLNCTADSMDSFKTKIHRWDNSIYFTYYLNTTIGISLGGHAIFQPLTDGNFFGAGSRPNKTIEFGTGLNIEFLIEKISIDLTFYQGISNRSNAFIFFEPLQSVGLKMGYPISLKEN